MATTFRVVLDACVMIPQTLNNLLLTLAEHDLYTPVWSSDLLEEVHRNLIAKIGLSPEQADRRIAAMRRAFPHADAHSAGYRNLLEAMTNHPKDRHVLAAAVASNAQLIVTENLPDFPAGATAPHEVEVVHPDAFLLDQLDLDPHRVIAAITGLLERHTHPPQTMLELVETLRPKTPDFAHALHDLAQPVALLEIVDDDAVERQFHTNTDDPAVALRDPATAAFLWWSSLVQRDRFPDAAGNISINPDEWDFDAAARLLDGYAPTTGVHDHTDRDDVVYLKFIPDTGHSMRAFGEFAVTDIRVLAMQRNPHGQWLAYGLIYDAWPSHANPRARVPDTN